MKTLDQLAQGHLKQGVPVLYCRNKHQDTLMTDEQMIELWGDGTEFGMTSETIGAMNNAFREVAMKFAQRVAKLEYERGWESGWESGWKSRSAEMTYATGLVGDPQ